jgi:hypothetical protein
VVYTCQCTALNTMNLFFLFVVVYTCQWLGIPYILVSFLVHTLLMLLEKEQLLFCYAPVKAVKTSCIQLDSLLGSKL